jgi:hypothetical protein
MGGGNYGALININPARAMGTDGCAICDSCRGADQWTFRRTELTVARPRPPAPVCEWVENIYRIVSQLAVMTPRAAVQDVADRRRGGGRTFLARPAIDCPAATNHSYR